MKLLNAVMIKTAESMEVLRIVASGRTLEARNWAMLPNNFDLSNVASSCKQFGILGALAPQMH